MKILSMVCVGVLVSLLAACGSKSEENVAEPTGVIPKAQLDGLEKAKGVEQALLDAEESNKKTMAEQGL